MAKLNGVQTLDMVNGEITKVAYDGAEYAKVDADRKTAKVGDLFLANKERTDITKGAFYKVVYDTHNNNLYSGINISDDANHNHDRALLYGTFFRKVSTDSPTLEQRVSTLEAEVSALKGEAKASEEVITYEGAEYRKVDREAREGDVVIQNAETGSLIVKQGVPYKVELNGSCSGLSVNNRDLYNAHTGRTRETVDVYELVTKEQAYEPKVGDIVVVTANTVNSANKVGDIGKVGEEKPLGDGGVCVYVPGGPTSGIRTLPAEIRPATAEELAAYEKAQAEANETAKWAKLGRKVGEYKAGDIIEYGDSQPKDLYVVARVEGEEVHFYDDSYGCETEFMYASDREIRLIAPVDARFDN